MKGLCVRGQLETEQNCNILTPSSSVFSSTPFSFCCLLNRGPWGPSSLLGLVLTASNCNNWLQTTRTSCGTGLYNCLTPTCFSECRICTQFNLSIVKVILWYLRLDAPVIYTGAFLIWQLGRVVGQYVTSQKWEMWSSILKSMKGRSYCFINRSPL